MLLTTTLLSSLLPLALALPQQIPLFAAAPTSSSLQHATWLSVQLGVMSRCPDAHLCEALFDRVLEQRVTVLPGEGGDGRNGNKTREVTVLARELIDLSAVYIAKLNSSSPDGATCMHGELECRGSVQQLCAAHYWNEREKEEEEEEEEEEMWPGWGKKGGNGEGRRRERKKEGWEDWWNFIQCLNYGETSSIGTDAKARECAKVVNREWKGDVSSCVDSSLGRDLLVKSVKEAERLEVSKSCTVLIEGKQVCIHDSTWKSCPAGHEPADFARLIKEGWERKNGRGGREREEDDE
ncbi:hypothetical protein JCM8547_004066 [Rhodosporidiobolus lusitaniae]